MRGWRGILGGILGLSALYALVQPGASGRIGGLFGDASKLIANGIKRIADPSIAGLRDFREPGMSGKKPSSKQTKQILGGPR